MLDEEEKDFLSSRSSWILCVIIVLIWKRKGKIAYTCKGVELCCLRLGEAKCELEYFRRRTVGPWGFGGLFLHLLQLRNFKSTWNLSNQRTPGERVTGWAFCRNWKCISNCKMKSSENASLNGRTSRQFPECFCFMNQGRPFLQRSPRKANENVYLNFNFYFHRVVYSSSTNSPSPRPDVIYCHSALG